MPNDRLRDALLRSGLTAARLAEKIGVDPKTAARWITQDRVPYRRHRHAVATAIGEAESYLWPDAAVDEVSGSELIRLYPEPQRVSV